MFKILIVEDDTELCQLFSHVLEKNGYHTRMVSNGQEALDALAEEYVDLIISDIMMPVMDGYELVRSLRKKSVMTPVLMKPINVSEMVLRVGALLRRVQMMNEHRQVIGETVMECDSLTVTRGETSMILPQKEFMLLYKMAAYPGKIFTRQQLMDDIWGYDSDSDSHTVDVHIGRLRERFRDNPDFHIVTMRGVGYKVVKA